MTKAIGLDIERMKTDRAAADERIEVPITVTSFGDMELKRMRLEELQPAEYNPRRITPEAMAGLKASIEHFGLVQPIVFNKRTGKIVGGHQRVKALLDMGVQEDDVLVVDFDETKEKAANITLNNPNIGGLFTDDLEDMLLDLSKDAPNIFTSTRLEELIPPASSRFLDKFGDDKEEDYEADPSHSDRRETVNFIVPLTPEQNDTVFKALKKFRDSPHVAPGKRGTIKSGEALVAICDLYLESAETEETTDDSE